MGQIVVQNPQHTYRKDGVYYYCRNVSEDRLFKCNDTGIVMRPHMKSIAAARRSAAALTSRHNECWMTIQIAHLNIPSLLTTDIAAAGKIQIRICDALDNRSLSS